jgi:hypothetical protein
MALIISDKHQIPAAPEKVSDYLSIASNYRILFPADRIEDWQNEEKNFSFSLKGLARIGMEITEVESGKYVNLKSFGKNPFEFSLHVQIEPEADYCIIEITFDGQMNFMIEAMASKPLGNLFNNMATHLRGYFEAGR